MEPFGHTPLGACGLRLVSLSSPLDSLSRHKVDDYWSWSSPRLNVSVILPTEPGLGRDRMRLGDGNHCGYMLKSRAVRTILDPVCR